MRGRPRDSMFSASKCATARAWAMTTEPGASRRCGRDCAPQDQSHSSVRPLIPSAVNSVGRLDETRGPGSKQAKMPYIVDIRGAVVTRADFPPPNFNRWIPSRKATLVMAVRGGVISLDEACSRYRLTREEFAGWERALVTGGIKALRANELQLKRSRSSEVGRKLARRND